jgi:hypothetical protein
VRRFGVAYSRAVVLGLSGVRRDNCTFAEARTDD